MNHIPYNVRLAVKLIEDDYRKYKPQSWKTVDARRRRDDARKAENIRVSNETIAWMKKEGRSPYETAR